VTKRTLIVELRKEYERCVQVKNENMQKFIEKTRSEIKSLCDKMYFGKEEMKQIEQSLFRHNTHFNDELLQQHEAKLEDLKYAYAESSELFEKTTKWIDMWEQWVLFCERTKDPARLKTRGYSLLNEANERTRFEKTLPKLEADITSLATQFSEINGGQ
jgi:hypothetical protein